jgi:hypothetical protein
MLIGIRTRYLFFERRCNLLSVTVYDLIQDLYKELTTSVCNATGKPSEPEQNLSNEHNQILWRHAPHFSGLFVVSY